MNESKIVIDDKTQKMLEVKEKKVVEDDTKGYRITERYAVIKLSEDELVPEVTVLEVLRDWMIPYKLVEVVELEE